MLSYFEESDEELALLSQQGSDTAVEELLGRHRKTVKEVAAGFHVLRDEREDLLQEGMIGLWKAVQAFRRSHGARFVTLAKVCVRRHMLSALRNMRISSLLPVEEASRPSRWIFREEVLSGMTALERAAFEGHLAGESYTDISAELKIPPKMVDNALQRAKRKARRRLGLEDKVARKAFGGPAFKGWAGVAQR